MIENRDCASAFAPNRYLRRVAAESCDVLGNPLKTLSLIFESKIGRAIGLQLFSSQEAEPAKAVVDSNEDNSVSEGNRLRDQRSAIIRLSGSKLKT